MSKLPLPILCLVTDRKLCGEASLEDKVAQALQGGVNVVQLREKDLPGGPLWKLAQSLRRMTQGLACFLVNERVDVALACGADGVQLGEEALPVTVARDLMGHEVLIGRSVHDVEGALQAQQDGADFLIVGTIFASRSHPGQTPAGVGLLARVVERVDVPVLGIGGINQDNVSEVMEAGASGVAVIGAILGSEKPKEAARSLWDNMLATWKPRVRP